MGTTLITQDLLEYANSLPAGFYSISTASGTPNAIGVSATGYILRRTGVDAIVALYGITSGTLNVNHYDGHTWLGWLKYTTNTDFDSVGLPKPKSVTDLYGILNSGFFSYNKDANGNPVPDRGGLGICLYESTAWVVLIVIPYNNTTIYIASKISSAWSNWYKLNPVSTTQ